MGEALIDFISMDMADSLDQSNDFHSFIGGQVTNLTITMAKLGVPSSLAACVGNDTFGRSIKIQLEKNGVETSNLRFTQSEPTSVSIITRQTKTPDFVVLRGADSQLHYSTKIEQTIKQCRNFHTSAFALSQDPARTTILKGMRLAHQLGKTVSLDPNYHPKIWPDTERFIPLLQDTYQYVDLTKPSLDDCHRLFGSGLEPAQYLEKFLEWGAKIVLLTMGVEGVLLGTADNDPILLQSTPTEVIDVTGAGDAFWAGLLTGLADDKSPLEAAKIGQVLAEQKIGTLGPLPGNLEYDALYRQSKRIETQKL